MAGLSIEKTLLPLDIPLHDGIPAGEWIVACLNNVQQCYNEIRDSLLEFCPVYDVVEGDFPYQPDGNKRIMANGSVERRLSDVYILTMDIIGSTNSDQTNALKDSIIETLIRFKGRGIHHEVTGNDAFVACCADARTLWDLAKSIALSGERFRVSGQRLNGTRKALSVGTVSVVERPNGGAMIRDIDKPNALPRAFYVLDAVDRFCEKSTVSGNRVIAIEARTAKDLQSTLLLQIGDMETVKVSNKHFSGTCYCVPLTNH